MKSISDYFDEAKAITGSDRQTAIQMGIAPNRISMARKDGCMSNEFCAALAAVLGISPLEIIAAAEVKKHPSKAEFWGRWVACLAIVAAGIVELIGGDSPLLSMGYDSSLLAFSVVPVYTLCAVMVAALFVILFLAAVRFVPNIAVSSGTTRTV